VLAAAAVAALAVAWIDAAAAQENAALEALDRMDLGEACGLWADYLAEDDGRARSAAIQLEEWLERCPLDGRVAFLSERAARTRLDAAHVYRMHALAHGAGLKYRDAAVASMEPLRLSPAAGRTSMSSAPVVTALSAVPVAPPGDPPGPAWLGTVQTTRFRFTVRGDEVLYLHLELPNPASVWLDGEALAVSDRSAGGGSDLYLSVRFAAGEHFLDVIQAVLTTLPPEIRILPRDAAVEAPPAGGGAQSAQGSAAAGPALRRWTLVQDSERGGAAAGSATASTAASEAGNRAPGGPGEGTCRALLDTVRTRLGNGEDQAAETILNDADPACLETADGLLVQAELALSRQWTPLLDEYVEAAFSRYPQDCEVLTRWVSRRLERSEIPAAESLPVVCEGVERLLRPFAGRPKSEDAVELFRDAGRTFRLRLLPSLLSGDDPAVEEALLRLSASDLTVGWMLVDWWLSRGKTARAALLGEALRDHPAAMGGIRSQAGRLFTWERTRSDWTDPEEAVQAYLESGFGHDMPQVVVLDEAIAVPSRNGWFTLVLTTLTHLESPDAAESVGEISLAADEELLELAVRKADGSWRGPEETGASGAGKDTISLPGLAPGDFVLRRTVRELQADSLGGCLRLPPFYFGHRDLPVFLTRYVVVHGGADLVFHRHGEVEVGAPRSGKWEFVRRKVAPVPAEPWCPDPEAGVSMVEVTSRCLDWTRLRDGVGDKAGRLCDVPSPFRSGRGSAEALYREVLARVEVDSGVGVLSRSFSQTLETGSGSGVLAVYCAMLQAGLDAHLVAVSSAAAPPLDLLRPSLAGFDGTVVYVGGREPAWFDPYDPLSPPGKLRRSFAGRPGLVLTPLNPRLFVTLPRAGAVDSWKIVVRGTIDGDGALAGHLEIGGMGQAAAELRREADGAAEQVERLAAGVLGQVLPEVHVEQARFDIRGRKAVLGVEFARSPTAEERFLLLMPPIPAREFTQLPVRTSPLYFPGFYDIELDIELETEAGRFVVAAGKQELDCEFGRIDLQVENSGDRLRLTKRASAAPVAVSPDDYAGLAQFLSSARRLAGLAVEVVDAPTRD